MDGARDQDATQPTATEPTPGAVLRSARERRGMSIQDVAQSLRLDAMKIEALEADHFDALPHERAYLYGYLRSYARLVGLPDETVIGAYERMIGTALPPPPLSGSSLHGIETRSGDRPVRWVSYLILAVLVILALVWWQARETPVEQAPLPATDVPSADGSGLSLPPPEPLSTEEAGPPAETTAPVESPEATARAQDVPLATAPSAPAEPAPAPIVAAPATEGEVTLRFVTDSWAEVVDADGKRLMSSTGRAGQVRNFKGSPPFKVRIGYAPGVRVDYNGKPFDFSSSIHKDTARFTLGER